MTDTTGVAGSRHFPGARGDAIHTPVTERVAIPSELLELAAEPLAIRESALRQVYAWLDAGSIPVTALSFDRPRPARSTQGATSVIQVHGPITRRPTALSFLCGGASTEEISAQLRDALADDGVDRIVLDVDSPGGTIDGIPELAAEIHAAREQKPIVALVDTVAASAAYWLASQANEIVVTPSAKVGSIGVFAVHVDESRALELRGVRPTIVHAGKFKVEESSAYPLSDEARASIQERVDAYHAMFVRDVARGRGVTEDRVRADFGQGRVVLAEAAVAAGMADRVGISADLGMRRTGRPGEAARASATHSTADAEREELELLAAGAK